LRYRVVGGGAATGVLWFLCLSAAEGLRAEVVRVGTGSGILPGILLAVTTSAISFVLLMRLERLFSAVVALAIVLCIIVGFLSDSMAVAASQPALFELPTSLTRGAGSLSVWVALIGTLILFTFGNGTHLRGKLASSRTKREHQNSP
jgi:hypothetical protein